MSTPLLLLPERGIRRCPPKDRAIWLVANIVTKIECFTEVEGYEGYARWNEASQDWQDSRNMSIRCDYDAELYPLDWLELHERAANAPESETDLRSNIYHWDDEWRRECGQAGFYAIVGLSHHPTMETIAERVAGPFPLRSLAVFALVSMIAEMTQPEAAQAEAA